MNNKYNKQNKIKMTKIMDCRDLQLEKLQHEY